MENIWSRFDDIAGVDDVVTELNNTFVRPPDGERVVRLENIVPTETQTGIPVAEFFFYDEELQGKFSHRMFLMNINYPENNAKNIAKVIKFTNRFLDKEQQIEPCSLGKLAEKLQEVDTGDKKFVVKITTPENSKYSQVSFVREIDKYDFDVDDLM